MSPDQCFAILKDVVVTVSAAIGASVALRGLNTWNRQLKGGAEYELSRRVLKCTYLLRDAFKRVRNPFMMAAEMPAPPRQPGHELTQDDVHFYGMSKAYETRWNFVVEASTNLQAELLEAEVLWGKDAVDEFEPLNKLKHELMLAVRHEVDMNNPKMSKELKDARVAVRSKKREVLYDMDDEKEDGFASDLSKAVKRVETALKPHLHK